MAGYEFYFKFDATKQGKSKGTSPRGPWKDWAPALHIDYEVSAPYDISSGHASGKRIHKPITITKAWDANTPLLFTALTTNEVLKTVEFNFVLPNKEGKEEVYFTITLTDAVVAAQKLYMSGGGQKMLREDVHDLEDVSFTFRKIEVESKLAKTMATDDWFAG